jgi:transglutaminase-like putative cysteine protease
MRNPGEVTPWVVTLLVLLGGTGPAPVAAGRRRPARDGEPRKREFLFTYAATVTGLTPGKVARVWVPVPPTGDEQRAELVTRELPAGAEAKLGREAVHGNTVLYFEAKADAAGEVPFKFVYRVTRCEVKGECADDTSAAVLAQYLRADRMVPVGGKPARLLAGKQVPADPERAGRMLYDLVLGYMTYGKDTPGWGNGDAEWACDSRTGNCSDFHSLFISLARFRHIPAKFEIGFALPEQRNAAGGEIGGYHCWAKFRPEGRGWVPVDISEADKRPEKAEYFFGNLCENRVAFSTGRDLVLVPKQDGPPLNFFVYPYAEIDGRSWPADKVKRQFGFKDLPPAGRSDPQ